MGLDIYLYDGDESVDELSEKHPEHICNKGYLRSSYNESGFNNFVGNLIGMDLYTVFEPLGEPDENGELHPISSRLLSCRLNALKLLNELKAADSVCVDSIPAAPPKGTQPKAQTGAKDAINFYREEVKKMRDSQKEAAEKGLSPDMRFGNYSNSVGYFFLATPEIVRGAIGGVDVLNRPCVHLICEADKTFYVEMAEILVEFIDRAMQCDMARIVWSA